MLVDPYLSMCVYILYLYNQIHVHEASICDITMLSTIGSSTQTIIINYLGYSYGLQDGANTVESCGQGKRFG